MAQNPEIILKGKDEVTPVIDKVKKSLGGLEVTGKSVKNALTAVTAAAAGVGYALMKTLEATGQLADTAAQLGISATNLKNLQNASSLAGVGADELSASLFKLKQNLGDALVKGTGPADAALKRLKLSAQDLSTLTLDEQFDEITRALGQVQNPAERAALAVDLLGKQGAKIANLTEEANKLKNEINGVVGEITDLDISNIDAVDDAFGKVNMTLKQGMQKALSDMAPYILSMVDTFMKGIKFIKDNWESILSVLKVVGLVLAGLALYFSPIIIAVGLVAAAFYKWPKAFGAVAEFILGVINTFIIAPIEFVIEKIIGIGAAMSAIANGKNPIDAYNKATKEFKGLSGVFGDVNTIQGELVEKAAKEKKEREANAGLVKAQNEEAEKALKALGDTLLKLGQANQFEREKLSLGEEQATINKRIAEETAKLKDKGVEITQGHKDVITLLTQEEFAIKRQNDLLAAQKGLVEGFLNAQTGGEKLLTDIQNVKRIIAGEEIVLPIKLRTPEDVAANVGRALTEAEKQVGLFVDGTIAQYSKLYGEAFQITNDYNKAIKDIDTAIALAREAGGTRELERITALEEAKLAVEQNAHRRRLEMEINLFNERNKIRDMERQRDANNTALALENEKDIFGGKMFSSQQIDDIAKKTAENKKAYEENATKFVIGQGADALAALGTQNKAAFQAYKAFKIAQTIMDTISGARAAFASLAPIPFVGVPLGIAAAAAAVAAGMAQVAQIRSLTYSGRALGGPVMGGKPYLVGENGPEMFTPATTGSITRNSDLGQSAPVNVNFTIVANDTQGFDQLLTSRKGVIQQIISDAMLERGQRSMV